MLSLKRQHSLPEQCCCCRWHLQHTVLLLSFTAGIFPIKQFTTLDISAHQAKTHTNYADDVRQTGPWICSGSNKVVVFFSLVTPTSTEPTVWSVLTCRSAALSQRPHIESLGRFQIHGVKPKTKKEKEKKLTLPKQAKKLSAHLKAPDCSAKTVLISLAAAASLRHFLFSCCFWQEGKQGFKTKMPQSSPTSSEQCARWVLTDSLCARWLPSISLIFFPFHLYL